MKLALLFVANVLAAGCASTPLISAVSSGDSRRVSALLDAGADVRALDPVWGYSALELAACDGNEEVVKEFIRHKVDLNGVTATPLYRASACTPHHPGVVRLLLDAGATVDDLTNSLIGDPAYAAANPDIARMIRNARNGRLESVPPPAAASPPAQDQPAAPAAKAWWEK